MDNVVIKKDDKIIEIETKLDKSIKYCTELVIDSPEAAKMAADEIGFIKNFKKTVGERKLEATKAYRDAVTAFNNTVSEVVDKAEQALKIISPKYIKYIEDEEAKERERVRKEREALAEEERKKAAVIEADIINIAEENNTPELLDQAIQINEEAEQKIQEMQAKSIETKTSVKGFSFSAGLRKTWKAEIVDMEAFLKYVLESKRFELVVPEKTNIGNFARNVGKGFSKTEKEKTNFGIRVYYETGTASR